MATRRFYARLSAKPFAIAASISATNCAARSTSKPSRSRRSASRQLNSSFKTLLAFTLAMSHVGSFFHASSTLAREAAIVAHVAAVSRAPSKRWCAIAAELFLSRQSNVGRKFNATFPARDHRPLAVTPRCHTTATKRNSARHAST